MECFGDPHPPSPTHTHTLKSLKPHGIKLFIEMTLKKHGTDDTEIWLFYAYGPWAIVSPCLDLVVLVLVSVGVANLNHQQVQMSFCSGMSAQQLLVPLTFKMFFTSVKQLLTLAFINKVPQKHYFLPTL